MIKTACELALHPQLPLKSFKLLVQCQWMHGVALISRKDDNHAVSEYLGSIVASIQEKVAVIMASSHFCSLLSDESQARKTGSDKELVVIRTERVVYQFILHSVSLKYLALVEQALHL